MTLRNSLFLFFISLLFVHCDNESTSGGMVVQGTIQNANDLTAFVDKKNLDSAVQPINSAEIKSNGSYAVGLAEPLEAGIYRVRFGAKSADLILDGSEKKIRVDGDINNLDNFEYTVVGSPLSEQYRQYIKGMIEKTTTKQQLENFIVNEADPILAMALILGTAKPNPQLHATYEGIAKKLQAQYPDVDITRQFVEFSNTMKQQYNKQQSRYKVRLGQEAPDIVMQDVNGKTRKLSDLKGKLVLLDFWASWCGPCRRANPHVVEMYHKYKDEGFTVFSVSLDGLDSRTKKRFPANQLDAQMKRSKQRWLDAIAKDKLVWDTHVSDLKKWDSEAASLYGVSSIPTTFLIGKDGNIVALNPRSNLEQEIQKNL